MLAFITQGLLLGIYAGATPGPFLAFLMAQSLRVGWRRTLPAAFAPLLSDSPAILLCIFILSQTPDWFISALRLVGGGVLLWMAYGTLSTARQNSLTEPSAANESSRSLIRATLMNLFNPNIYIFWSTIGAPIVLDGFKYSRIHGFSFIVAMYATLIPTLAVIIFLSGAANRFTPRVRTILSYALGGMLVLFGLYQISQGLIALL
ncbi:hypothetical protein ADN00_02025 [Ornatilinea apprima]|uniref:Lysine transporter LysE n=1 Tax=Ornatilinea apprima TaxID=1134406 RepID=A0A0P6XJB6_9CHLR|nr:LysE family translocator [Ornatilinea apprima]KPL80071.1 hypothetical protein ADN00_02025 [Ornatilinea apprima]